MGGHAAEPSLSIWTQKPWWCQPWTILLTGLTLVGGSWLVLRLWWVTTGVVLAVLLWWVVFLVLVPVAYRQQQVAGKDG